MIIPESNSFDVFPEIAFSQISFIASSAST